MKICSMCKERKPYSEYYKAKGCKDGYRGKCKKCVNEQQKRHREENKEYIAEWQKSYREENRESISEYKKRHYEENKEQIKEKVNRWCEENKDRRDEYQKRYNEENKEHLLKQQKLYREKNKEHILKQKKIEREKNKDRYIEYGKRYRKENPDKVYNYSLKRRSYKNHVRFTPIQRTELLKRDNYTCQSCGTKVHDRRNGKWDTPDKAHLDHIIPISKGGSSEPTNLRILCRTCNLSKHDKQDEQLNLFKQETLAK